MTHRFKSALALALMVATPALADEAAVGKPPVPHTGREVYVTVCQACHMADGKGGTGAGSVPALASNPRLKIAAYPIAMVARGRGAMPWFSDMLSPDQMAAVITYVRTSMGNNYPEPVTAEEVSRIGGPPKPSGR